MQSEYCPTCRTTTNMIVTVAPKEIANKDGKEKMITVKTYHCETCQLFVRSEDEEPRIAAGHPEHGKHAENQ